ncbi:MAG TPA: hypothetical protein VLA19_29775, partial [Herpetosiphonaceae bacterium]|nr:hypothetical protein [Herpetosiphonaceae bacterium]
SIEASTWQPAKLLPILWDVGQPGWSIIQELDKCSPNSRTFEGRTGAVYRRQVFGTVPSRVRHIFAQGLDILDFEKSIEYSVWNKVIVRGAQIESLAQTDVEEDIEDQVIGISPVGAPVPSPFIPTPPGVRVDESIYSDYIETVPDAQMIADNLLGRLKQPLLQGTLATFGLPDMSTGDAIGISVPNRSFATNAFIVGHSINGQPLRSSFRWRGSTAAEARPNQPPLPAMTIEVAYEWMYVGDTLTKHAIITVDARTSSDSDGTVEAWTLAIGGTIYSGTDITLALVSHPTTAASPVAVTLTVTDDAGLSATLAQNATWDDSTVVIEPLTTAEKTLGAASTNGEQTWNEFTAPITAVAPIALGSGTLYFCSNGDIWRSTDLLETDPTKVATLPAAVNCAWNNEISTSRWICGLANGDIWLSVDDGVTWVKVGALPFPINDISESPHAPGQATAAAGNTLWTTFDLVNWSPLITHTAECLRFAAGMYGGVNVVYAGFADGTIKRYVD